MRHVARSLPVLAALCFTLPTSAAAQSEYGWPAGRGFMVSGNALGVLGFDLEEEDGGSAAEVDAGYGAGLEAGWAFSRNLTVFAGIEYWNLGVDEEGVDDVTGGALYGGVKIGFSIPETPVAPYVTLAYGMRELSAEGTFEVEGDPVQGELEFSGDVFEIGAGIHYFLGPSFALDGAVIAGFGMFDEAELPGVGTVNPMLDRTRITRIKVGVTWYPFMNTL